MNKKLDIIEKTNDIKYEVTTYYKVYKNIFGKKKRIKFKTTAILKQKCILSNGNEVYINLPTEYIDKDF